MMHVLNLGAGIQSTVLYAMACDGELPIDVAIFADTGDEPQAVYDHVEFLQRMKGPKIIKVSAGNLGDNLIRGVNATGQRFVSIPAFLSSGNDGENSGIGRRQCTKEYKLVPIEAEIRRMLGVEPGHRLPKGVEVTQYFGLSFDEPKRVARVKDRFRGRKQWFCQFPLFDEFITRQDCVEWLKDRWPNIRVPRSACVYCPYRSDEEWMDLKENDPKAWSRAIEIDRAIREPTSVCTRDMDSTQYLHRSCVPLELVQLQPKPDNQKRLSFSAMDCDGMCGH